MAEECAVCGEEKLLNGSKNYKQPVWAVSSFLTLCLAVGASGEKTLICTNGLCAQSLLLSAAQTLNSTLNHRQLPLLVRTNFLFFSLAPNTVQHQFLLCTLHQISLCSAAPTFLSAQQHQILLCSAAPNFLLHLFTTLHFDPKVVCFIATQESVIDPVVW